MQRINRNDFAQREEATRDLVALGRSAYPALLKASKAESIELESKQRFEKVLQEIRKHIPNDQLKFADEDTVQTAAAILKGKITVNTLKIHAAVLGDLQLPLANLRSVRNMARVRLVRIEAAAGMEPWIETDLELQPGTRFRIKVSGTIGMVVGGQSHSTGPQGSQELQRIVNSNVGHTVHSPVGALQGRLMREGKAAVFPIGERYETVTAEGGRLSLLIYMGGPHQFAVSGGYQLEIEVE
jgi:hypothetical protein